MFNSFKCGDVRVLCAIGNSALLELAQRIGVAFRKEERNKSIYIEFRNGRGSQLWFRTGGEKG
jgi:hypothetical protein